jgi:phospho-N-acetylmuramoyl-pentapeptide-transferase
VEKHMSALWTMAAAILAFTITTVMGKIMIPFLHKIKYGQTILEIGPSWHKNKQGTPTMGGIFFIVGTVAASVVCIPAYYITSEFFGFHAIETPVVTAKIFAGICMAIFYAAVGFADDFIKVIKKRNKGLGAKQKLVLQFLIAAAYLFAVYMVESGNDVRNITSIAIPFYSQVDFGFFYWVISSVLIVGIVNAVNLCDGVDGLASSVAFFTGIFFLVISSLLGMLGFSILSAAMVGGCLGFLVWNFYPAKIFMGDTGSFFLGALICAIGLGMGRHVILIIVSMVYILEMLSVILQVIYFKITHGKRLFKMSPIHHHFEMIGWSETKICVIFSGAAVVFGILAFLMSIYVP